MKRLFFVSLAILVASGFLYWAATRYEVVRRENAEVAVLCDGCINTEGWRQVSEYSSSQPNWSLAEWGVPKFVAYVKAIMSPESERKLSAVRVEIIAREVGTVAH